MKGIAEVRYSEVLQEKPSGRAEKRKNSFRIISDGEVDLKGHDEERGSTNSSPE